MIVTLTCSCHKKECIVSCDHCIALSLCTIFHLANFIFYLYMLCFVLGIIFTNKKGALRAVSINSSSFQIFLSTSKRPWPKENLWIERRPSFSAFAGIGSKRKICSASVGRYPPSLRRRGLVILQILLLLFKGIVSSDSIFIKFCEVTSMHSCVR